MRPLKIRRLYTCMHYHDNQFILTFSFLGVHMGKIKQSKAAVKARSKRRRKEKRKRYIETIYVLFAS